MQQAGQIGTVSYPTSGVEGCRQAVWEHSKLVCALMAAARPQNASPATSPSPAAPPHTHSTGCLPVSLLWVADWADRTASFLAMKRLAASWALLCRSQLLDAAAAGGARRMACAYMAWRSSLMRQF